MAIPVISLLSFNQAAAPTVAGSTFTPANGSLLVIINEVTESSTLAGVGISNTASLSPTNLFLLDTTGGFRTLMQVRYVAIGTGVSMSFSTTGTGGDHASLRVLQVTGQNASPIGATISQLIGAAFDGAKTITLSGTPASDSIVLSGIGGTLSAGGMSVDAGADQTELYDVSYDDWNNQQIQSRDGTVNTSTSISWADIAVGDAYANPPVAWAVELKSSGSAPTDPMLVGAMCL